MNDVCVVGLGYIGLPTAAMLALGGQRVAGYDTSADVRANLRSNEPVIGEAAVREVVCAAIGAGRLRIVDDLAEADAYIICVPTPTHDHRPDLSYVRQASAAVAAVAPAGALLIVESTIPPGTTERVVVDALQRAGRDPDDFALVHCPERVIPGAIVEELRGNDRVIGGRKPGDAERARDLYSAFVAGRMHLTDCLTAEVVKVVENTYRDVNIAFANELALLSEELGVDAWEAIRLANNHPRVNILSPGPGVGGHCIPVDPHFLSNANPFVTELIQTARRINERMPHVVARRVQEHVPPGKGAKLALLGAAYKADVDDTRESPAIRIDELLREAGYATEIFDPVARSFVRPLAPSLEAALSGADAIVLITDHREFKTLDPAVAARAMRGRVLVDARNVLDAAAWERAGFLVYSLGARRADRPALAAAS